MGKTTSEAPKGRILTAKELEIADALSSAMIGKAAAVGALDAFRKEVGKQTQAAAELPRLRSNAVWAEVREKVGSPKALTRAELVKGT